MKEQKKVYITATILVIIATILIILRIKYQFYTELEPGESIWKLTYEIQIPKASKGTRINVSFPRNTSNVKIIEEKFFRPNWIVDIVSHSYTKNREAIGVILQKNQSANFIAEFNLHMDARNEKTTFYEELSVEKRAQYLKSEEGVQIDDQPSQIITASLREKDKNVDLIKHIFMYCQNIKKTSRSFPDTSSSVIINNKGSLIGVARTMITLCRSNQIPARLITGFVIEKRHSITPHHWLEIYDVDKWVSYDPWYGYEKEVPHNYLPVCYSRTYILRVNKASNWEQRFSLQQLSNFYYLSRDEKIFHPLDLTRLDLSMQEVLSILLLLPFSALITMFFRNVIGIKTFGTFSPCLLALSFVYGDWHTGVIVLSGVVIAGLLLRSLLNSLKLLAIARLGILLTLVVLCIVISISLLHHWQLTPGAKTVLFPLVVMTMIIENFHIRWEEDGLKQAQKLLFSTFIVALCCYIIISWKSLGRWAIMFPESLLYIIAGMLLLGRYAGYRFTELLRFHDFVKREN